MKAFVLVVFLTGCANSAWQVSAGQPPPHAAAQVQVSAGPWLAALMGAAILGIGLHEALYGTEFPGTSRNPPDMAPDRKVSEQDCTKPLDLTLGNLRCK